MLVSLHCTFSLYYGISWARSFRGQGEVELDRYCTVIACPYRSTWSSRMSQFSTMNTWFSPPPNRRLWIDYAAFIYCLASRALRRLHCHSIGRDLFRLDELFSWSGKSRSAMRLDLYLRERVSLRDWLFQLSAVRWSWRRFRHVQVGNYRSIF